METIVSLAAIVTLIGVLSTLATRLLTRKRGALWAWRHASVIGWLFIALGIGLIAFGFIVDKSGPAMSAKLGLGSLLLTLGLWMIW